MKDEELEKLARDMERAYSTESNRENAVALVLHDNPGADLFLVRGMWEAIDRFVDLADAQGAFK